MLLIGLLLPCVFTQESALIRLYSSEKAQFIEGKLLAVLSLCTEVRAEGDFVLSLSPPCLETPSNMRLFVVSQRAARNLDLKLVKVTATVRPGDFQVWEITLPSEISLSNIHRIALGIETETLPCPKAVQSPVHSLQKVLSTGFSWACGPLPSCPSLCASPRLLSHRVVQDCEKDRDHLDSEEQDCEAESTSKSSAAVAVVAVVTVLGWY